MSVVLISISKDIECQGENPLRQTVPGIFVCDVKLQDVYEKDHDFSLPFVVARALQCPRNRQGPFKRLQHSPRYL